MEGTLFNKNGEVVSTGHNGGFIRRYVSKLRNTFLKFPDSVEVNTFTDGTANLTVNWYEGPSYTESWASHVVLCEALKRWRNLYGAKLIVNHECLGVVSYQDSYLSTHARF